MNLPTDRAHGSIAKVMDKLIAQLKVGFCDMSELKGTLIKSHGTFYDLILALILQDLKLSI